MNFILNLLFPKSCLGCRKLGAYFCARCASEIARSAQSPICPVCTRPAVGGVAHPYCRTKYALDGFIGVFRYTDSIRKAIKAIKFRRQSAIVEELSNLTAEFINKNTNGFYTPLLTFLTKTKPVIVPIPLYYSRKRKRWFNQSELIARRLADCYNLSVNPDVLIRVKSSVPQAQLKRKERLINVKNSFAISPCLLSPVSNYLIVDDVWTTGATMREAGSVLKRNGAKTIWGLTIAR